MNPTCPYCGKPTGISATYVDNRWTWRCTRQNCRRISQTEARIAELERALAALRAAPWTPSPFAS